MKKILFFAILVISFSDCQDKTNLTFTDDELMISVPDSELYVRVKRKVPENQSLPGSLLFTML